MAAWFIIIVTTSTRWSNTYFVPLLIFTSFLLELLTFLTQNSFCISYFSYNICFSLSTRETKPQESGNVHSWTNYKCCCIFWCFAVFKIIYAFSNAWWIYVWWFYRYILNMERLRYYLVIFVCFADLNHVCTLLPIANNCVCRVQVVQTTKPNMRIDSITLWRCAITR